MIYNISGQYIVYKLTFPNGKIYIGLTSRPLAKRWNKGKGYNNQPAISQAIKDAGGWENVKKEILVDGTTKCMAGKFEHFFVVIFNSQWPNGYNKDGGGFAGYKRCRDTVEKYTSPRKKPIAKISNETSEILSVYDSCASASADCHISDGDISLAARGKRKKAGGYKWAYIEDLQAAGAIPAAVHFDEERII